MFFLNLLVLAGVLLVTYLYVSVPDFVGSLIPDTNAAKAATIFFTVIIVCFVLSSLTLTLASVLYLFAGAGVMVYKLFLAPSNTAKPAA
jgi:hypothetical protein